jgi:hypothetical protein
MEGLAQLEDDAFIINLKVGRSLKHGWVVALQDVHNLASA